MSKRASVSQKSIRHWGRCRRDFPFYAENHLKIVTKSAQLVPFTIRYAQDIVHKKLAKQLQTKGFVKAIILKARQEGISTYTAARFFRRVHLFSHQKAMIIADQKDKGAVLFDIYERYHSNIPDHERPGRKYGEKGMRLVLDNGSSINVETARDAYAARGSTVQALHASEMAFWDKAADTWNSISQAVPDEGSEIIIESTANGVGNFFHQMWEAAEQGQSDYIAIFLPWWIHEEYTSPNATQEELDAVIHSVDEFEREAQDKGIPWEGHLHKLTPYQLVWRRKTIANKCAGNVLMFQQEYPATAREAFIVSGNTFFSPEALQHYETRTQEPIARGNFIEEGGIIRFEESARGYVRIWEWPDKNCVYDIGADTAAGKSVGGSASTFSDPDSERGGSDFSCAVVIDAKNFKEVAQVHGRMDTDVFAQQLNAVGRFYASKSHSGGLPALLAVEKNHWSGEQVLKTLKEKYRYPNLYYSRQEGRRFNKPTPVLGWVTSVATRGPLLEGLASAVRNFAIDIYSAETVREMFMFVRGEDGKPAAQEGAHDDRVIATAISLAIAPHAYHSERKDSYSPPETADSATGW